VRILSDKQNGSNRFLNDDVGVKVVDLIERKIKGENVEEEPNYVKHIIYINNDAADAAAAVVDIANYALGCTDAYNTVARAATVAVDVAIATIDYNCAPARKEHYTWMKNVLIEELKNS
jgi:hypothetical protein